MKQMTSVYHTLRDEQTRRTLMWVIAAVSALVFAYGAAQIVQGQLDYQDASDQVDKMTAQIKAFEAKFPTAEVDGKIKPDLTSATQEELMLLVTLKRQEREAKNERIDAYNKRAIGVRITGVGVIGLALAYTVAPARKKTGPASPVPEGNTLSSESSDLPPD